MARVIYVPNPLFEEEVEKELEFKEGIWATSKKIAALVKAFAPVREAKFKRRLPPGVYKRRIKALTTGVMADDPYWHWIEFGSVHNTPKAPMRRGFRAAGLRLVVHPKP